MWFSSLNILQAEMTRKQFENLSPAILKQVLPLVEQLPPLYMDLANGREDFCPKPEETQRLVNLVSTFSIFVMFLLSLPLHVFDINTILMPTHSVPRSIETWSFIITRLA